MPAQQWIRDLRTVTRPSPRAGQVQLRDLRVSLDAQSADDPLRDTLCAGRGPGSFLCPSRRGTVSRQICHRLRRSVAELHTVREPLPEAEGCLGPGLTPRIAERVDPLVRRLGREWPGPTGCGRRHMNGRDFRLLSTLVFCDLGVLRVGAVVGCG